MSQRMYTGQSENSNVVLKCLTLPHFLPPLLPSSLPPFFSFSLSSSFTASKPLQFSYMSALCFLPSLFLPPSFPTLSHILPLAHHHPSHYCHFNPPSHSPFLLAPFRIYCTLYMQTSEYTVKHGHVGGCIETEQRVCERPHSYIVRWFRVSGSSLSSVNLITSQAPL